MTYRGTPGKPKAFIVDVDGTLAHRNGRGPHEYHRVGEDIVDNVVRDIVNGMMVCGPYAVIIMSGRKESCRPETKEWLRDNNIMYDKLIMRAHKDYRPDDIVKKELFDTHVRDFYDIHFVIDDRWTVCKMWLQMGLKVLNVSGLDRGEF